MRSLKSLGRISLVRAARNASWKVDPRERAFLDELQSRVDRKRAPKIAVLYGQDDALARLLTTARPAALVAAIAADPPPKDMHARLAALGRFDVIVDDLRVQRYRSDLLRHTFWHLDRGSYLVRRFRTRTGATGEDVPGEQDHRKVGSLVMSLANRRRQRWAAIPPLGGHDQERLAAGIDEFRIAAGHIALTSGRRTHAKLRDHELDAVLRIRGSKLATILRTVPGETFSSRCDLRLPPGARRDRMPESYDVPTLWLREYRDVICGPEQLMMKDNLLLPDSFRHNLAPRLHSVAVREVGARFGDPDMPVYDTNVLPGMYYNIDNEHPWHFGHIITEEISRLWGWREAKAAHPELKALIGTRTGTHGGRELGNWIYTFLGAAGIDREDVVVLREPRRVETVISASPMLSMPDFIHPAITDVWRDMGDAIATGASDRFWPRRIFCSRRGGVRACHNVDEVENLFADFGFEVVLPETMPLADQVTLFRKAEVIGGFAGAGLFHLCWALEPKHVIALTHDAYTARNEYMISALLAHRLDFVTARPDIEHPVGGWSWEAFRSPFTLDMEAEGAYVESLLRDLD